MDCELCGKYIDSTTLLRISGAPRGERDDYLCARCEKMQKDHPDVFEFVTDVLKFAMIDPKD